MHPRTSGPRDEQTLAPQSPSTYLIFYLADFVPKDPDGLTALELADAAGQDEIVQLLREGK
jgi:ankyrin repeat protein